MVADEERRGRETLQFYRGNAQAYAGARNRQLSAAEPLSRAAAAGRRSSNSDAAPAPIRRKCWPRGFDVAPTDGSPEMAAIASRRLGRPVATLLFHDLDAVEAYDGVWANACLLHVPRAELAQVLR